MFETIVQFDLGLHRREQWFMLQYFWVIWWQANLKLFTWEERAKGL